MHAHPNVHADGSHACFQLISGGWCECSLATWVLNMFPWSSSRIGRKNVIAVTITTLHMKWAIRVRLQVLLLSPWRRCFGSLEGLAKFMPSAPCVLRLCGTNGCTRTASPQIDLRHNFKQVPQNCSNVHEIGHPRARCGMPTRYGSYMTQPQTVVLGRNVSPGRVRKKCTDASQIGGLFYQIVNAPWPSSGAVGSSQSVPIALVQLH